ncbi:endonuclease NucS domain-containing protein [Stygiolobus caldivivus]|uniref:Endonuclease NucS C-terminal domain-containing protein n=1 Tax=Stygiolobus caldivivus TaxID=2824673 RepID=A0A8D5U4A3_9CREN|nr:endonuclease NucS domain-containing protein [Stygiolobus caldivivus]BCU68797.1 hypothetical protein KN1_00940 [Stygiolobus caldivivus]
MEDEIAKWFRESVLRIVEKLKSGQELTNTEAYIALTYFYLQSFERKVEELERGLRDEIRKTREELLANDEKIKRELLENDERVKREIIEYMDKTKKELLENDEKIKRELLENDKVIKGELEAKIDEVKGEVAAIRSDLGILNESFFISNFLGSIKEGGERVTSVYKHYETPVGEVDAVVETDKAVYVIEVKFKAEIRDVDDLLTKVKEVEKDYQGKKVVPVLAGPKINKAVRGYAKGLNVMIYQ